MQTWCQHNMSRWDFKTRHFDWSLNLSSHTAATTAAIRLTHGHDTVPVVPLPELKQPLRASELCAKGCVECKGPNKVVLLWVVKEPPIHRNNMGQVHSPTWYEDFCAGLKMPSCPCSWRLCKPCCVNCVGSLGEMTSTEPVLLHPWASYGVVGSAIQTYLHGLERILWVFGKYEDEQGTDDIQSWEYMNHQVGSNWCMFGGWVWS